MNSRQSCDGRTKIPAGWHAHNHRRTKYFLLPDFNNLPAKTAAAPTFAPPNFRARGHFMSNETTQTGPTLFAGRERCSQNAATHGGTSEKLIVAGERREDFEALLNDLLDEFSPATAHARGMVEDAAMARWFLWRKLRAYNVIETALYAVEPDEANWSAEAHQKLALADRYKTAAERALKRAFNNVQVLRKNGQEDRRESRLGKKEEIEAQLAIAKASDSLRALDAKNWKTACNGFDRPTLLQKINVAVRQGVTVTTMSPSNAELIRELDRELYPPEQVCRQFDFPNGMPAEYYPFTANEEYRREKDHTIDQQLSIDIWREIAEEEQELGTGHAVPGRYLNELP